MVKKYQPKLYWSKLTPRHTVVVVKSPDGSHYETGSGALIYWDGRESARAQSHLERIKKRTIVKKK